MTRALARAILLRKRCWAALDRDDLRRLRKLVPETIRAERELLPAEWRRYVEFLRSNPVVAAVLEAQHATVH